MAYDGHHYTANNRKRFDRQAQCYASCYDATTYATYQTSFVPCQNTGTGLEVQPCSAASRLRSACASQAPDPKKVPTVDDEVYRRQILARSRNYLLGYALRNQEWAL